MFVLKNSAVKPRDAIGGKQEKPALIVVSGKNTQRSLPSPADSTTPQDIFLYLELIADNMFELSIVPHVP